jgi:hypothetical protein
VKDIAQDRFGGNSLVLKEVLASACATHPGNLGLVTMLTILKIPTK